MNCSAWRAVGGDLYVNMRQGGKGVDPVGPIGEISACECWHAAMVQHEGLVRVALPHALFSDLSHPRANRQQRSDQRFKVGVLPLALCNQRDARDSPTIRTPPFDG